MNIILFTDADVFAGTERHILDLAVALTALDQNVTVACPVPAPLADRAWAAGINVLAVAKKRMPDFAAIKILAGELRAGRVDIIHAHNGRTHLLAVAAVKFAGRGRVVATQHFLSPNRTGRRGPKAALANILHHWAERNTAAFVAISEAVKEQMLQRGDAPAEKITVVHNGTMEPERGSAERISALRAELGVADRLMVFCAARLQKEKDIPTLIKAFAALRTGAGGGGGIEQRTTINEQRATNNERAGSSPQRHPDSGQHAVDIGTARRHEITTTTSDGGIHNEVGEGYGGSLMVTTGDEQRINDTTQPVLLIAGEGDQRGECERLIRSMNNDQGKKNNDDSRSLGNTDGDEEIHKEVAEVTEGGDGGKNSEFRIQNLEANRSVALPKSSAFCLPSSVFSFHCSMYLLGFRSDVSALMAACDIFVSPCPVEGFGLVLLEAMALGKPVIAAAAGGPLEIVADGETGLLFEPGNAGSLAGAMRRLLADPDLRQRMGQAGRKRYEEKFTARRMAEKMQEVYRGVTG